MQRFSLRKKLIRGLLTAFIILLTHQQVAHYSLILLADGSKIYLKNDSSILFYAGQRYAELVGEASFYIVRSSTKFTLHLVRKGVIASTDSATFSVSTWGVTI